MIRGVIFDLGNTLMYFDGDWDEVLARGAEFMSGYLASHGVPVTPGFARDFLEQRASGRTRANTENIEYTAERALRDTLARHGMPEIAGDVLAGAIRAFFQFEEQGWRAYDDARATLVHLRAQGLQLALLSNATDHGFIERISRQGQIDEFFNPLLSSAALARRKPDPRAFDVVLDRWNLSPREVVMVGDWPSFDVLGAHRAGMPAILIEERWDRPTAWHVEIDDADLLTPDATILQLEELPAALARLNETLEREAIS